MKQPLRTTATRFALLAACAWATSGCLQDLTVGLDTQPLVSADAAPGQGLDGSIAPAPDSGPVDAGEVDAGPCMPRDCNDTVQVAVHKAESPCPTGETQVCERNESGSCELRCPPVPSELACGGAVHFAKCGANTFCRSEPGNCSGVGACSERPASCSLDVAQVCGCDGATYVNRCHAFYMGVNVMFYGPCL